MKNLIFLLFLLFPMSVHAEDVAVPVDKAETLTVEKIKDGDSIMLTNGQDIQLAGIRTPELHDTPKLPQEAQRFKKEVWQFRGLGDEAQRTVEGFIKQANNEILVETSSEAFDENENLLAYVFVPVLDTQADGKIMIQEGNHTYVFLNAYFLEAGLAEIKEPIDEKYHALFTQLESQAKEERKGLWS